MITEQGSLLNRHSLDVSLECSAGGGSAGGGTCARASASIDSVVGFGGTTTAGCSAAAWSACSASTCRDGVAVAVVAAAVAAVTAAALGRAAGAAVVVSTGLHTTHARTRGVTAWAAVILRVCTRGVAARCAWRVLTERAHDEYGRNR